MANPNLRNPTSITLGEISTSLANTSATVIVNNAASSGTVIEVTSLYICNDDGANDAEITIALHPQDDGAGTGVQILRTVTVPADATLVAISKDAPIVLLENQSLVATASAGNDLNCVGAYRVLA